jgi:riboflavin biosynthesis pyrimidine reductase
VAELKAKPAGELQVHGSGNLVRWLLDNRLVDEINLFVRPVVVGQGTRLFPTPAGHSTPAGRLASLPEGHHDPGLSAYRAPAVSNGHGRLKHVT